MPQAWNWRNKVEKKTLYPMSTLLSLISSTLTHSGRHEPHVLSLLAHAVPSVPKTKPKPLSPNRPSQVTYPQRLPRFSTVAQNDLLSHVSTALSP